MPKILVIGEIHRSGLQLLKNSDYSWISTREDYADFASSLAECDAILLRNADLNATAIAQAPQLKVVARHGVGYDRVDLEALTARRIPLAITTGANQYAVAEMTLTAILTCLKKVIPLHQALRRGEWHLRDRILGSELHGKSILLIGFGRIARALVPALQALGAEVSAYDPLIDKQVMLAMQVTAVADWRKALPQKDIVSLHTPLSTDTQAMIDDAALTSLSPHAILINTARGALIDEKALISALRAGRIAAVALDVFAQEPIASDHPLLQFSQVLALPHCAGLTTEAFARMSTMAVQNILDVLGGKLVAEKIVNYDAVIA